MIELDCVLNQRVTKSIFYGQAQDFRVYVPLEPSEELPPGVKEVVLVYERVSWTASDEDNTVTTEYVYQGVEIRPYTKADIGISAEQVNQAVRIIETGN